MAKNEAEQDLLYSIYKKNIEEIKVLLPQITQINDPYNILEEAISSKRLKIVELILKDFKSRNIDLKDVIRPNGSTTLICAIYSLKKEIVQLLIDYGIDVKQSNIFGYTPLHAAVSVSSIEISQLLIEHGANVNAMYNDRVNEYANLTPLHMAAMKGDMQMLKLFIRNGGDVNLKFGILSRKTGEIRKDSKYHRTVEEICYQNKIGPAYLLMRQELEEEIEAENAKKIDSTNTSKQNDLYSSSASEEVADKTSNLKKRKAIDFSSIPEMPPMIISPEVSDNEEESKPTPPKRPRYADSAVKNSSKSELGI